MPDNGSGTYSLPQAAFIAGTTISSTAVNSNFSDMATALNNRMTRNGESAPSGNVPMGTFKHTGVGSATARTEYASAGQVADGGLVWGGTSTGSANVQAISPTPGVPAYVTGQRFVFQVGFTNTAGWTLAVSGLAAVAVLGAVVVGQIVQVTYDGTAFRLQGVAAVANAIINGGFRVNQRAYASGVATAAGVYMHDRWKAGASGGTYTFTQATGPFTTVTITAGTIVQVIEALNIAGGAYTLTWTGTATAKLNGGTAAASPITANLPANTNATAEFLTGTVSRVQLSVGTGVLEPLSIAAELALCMRYYETGQATAGFGAYAATVTNYFPLSFVPKRAVPTMAQSPAGLVNITTQTITPYSSSSGYITQVATNSGSVAGTMIWTANAEL